nr:RNA-directed DNA polymerase, eukaryota, reverse transcriptase zinc-binding domain protein [Tanacetum cinerariifolium]
MAIPPRGRALDDLSALKLSIGELSLTENGSDRWIWDKECSGSFKVNTLTIRLQDILLADDHLGIEILGITLPSVACPFCDVDEEDLDHCFLKCPRSWFFCKSGLSQAQQNYPWRFPVWCMDDLEVEKQGDSCPD